MNGTSTNAEDERVLFTEVSEDTFEPQVNSFGTVRNMDGDDMPRVVDFEGAVEAPPDGPLLMARNEHDRNEDDLQFPTYHFCLRGAFLFYFALEDVDSDSGPYTSYLGAPLGVVPLHETVVEFPPGGRRIFREHAAHPKVPRKGYELVVLHEGEGERPPFFIIADGLSERKSWAEAIRDRAERSTNNNQPTNLRAGYSKTTQPRQQDEAAAAATPSAAAGHQKQKRSGSMAMGGAAGDEPPPDVEKKAVRRASSSFKRRETKSIRPNMSHIPLHDDKDLVNAIEEFGMAKFDEHRWLDNFFERNNDFDAPTKCRQMEHWQSDMKKSLKGAVLEQYVYFVQASGEMTTMGSEVARLKTMIETQVDTLKELKELDILGAMKVRKYQDDDRDEIMGRLDRQDDSKKMMLLSDTTSLTSHMSSSGTGTASSRRASHEPDDSEHDADHADNDDNDDDDDDAPRIEIPDWLDDVDDEVAAITRECRYKDAIDMLLKGRAEVLDLLDKHDRPTAYRMQRSDHDRMIRLRGSLEKLRKRIGKRLAETLRRKNEALKQAGKRDRTTEATGASLTISPCALHDDAPYLRLLIKVGHTQSAAQAYTMRRSLLLLETLHERPISGVGTVDLVIYAAQLSQSFFSSLAQSVEGFLDLFLSSSASGANNTNTGSNMLSASQHEELSLGESTNPGASGVPPSGAMSSVVLWCDAELTKFANAFGGSRILANLALSPPPMPDAASQHQRNGSSSNSNSKPRVLGSGDGDDASSKERKNAIQVASQCLHQAFLYATVNLDSVGLPLAPRLAECLRQRLKGCEREVAELMDARWLHLISDWKQPPPMDSTMQMRM